jgi:hypothetical protein
MTGLYHFLPSVDATVLYPEKEILKAKSTTKSNTKLTSTKIKH